MPKTATRNLCLGTVLAVALAFAGTIPSAQAGSEEKARILLDTMNSRQNGEAAAMRIIDAMLDGMQRGSRTPLPADVPDIIKGVVKGAMDDQLPLIFDDTVKVYAANLSDEEMDALTAFYRTPVGQDYLQKLPILQQQGAKLAQARMAAVMPEVRRALFQKLQEKHPEMFQRGPGTELNPVPR